MSKQKKVQVRLLGTPQILIDDTPVPAFERTKSEALLYYLLTTGQAHTRVELATLLWPDNNPASTRRYIRTHLVPIRQHLDDYLTSTSDTLAFYPHPNCDVDVHYFCSLYGINFSQPGSTQAGSTQINMMLADVAERQRVRTIADRYQGTFLAGFAVSNTEPYQRWMDQMREELSTRAATLYHQLAMAEVSHENHTQALTDIDRLLTIIPWHEEGYRLKMQVLSAQGARWAALKQYGILKEILATELDVLPDAETEQLVKRIREGDDEGGPGDITEGASSTENDQAGSAQRGRAQSNIPPRNDSAPVFHYPPIPLTPLLGQDALLTEAYASLQNPAYRLLTLTGMGGVGKSHMAMTLGQQCYEQKESRFADGVCFVPLGGIAPFTSGRSTNQSTPQHETQEAILIEMADALNLPPGSRVDLREQITRYLRTRTLLIIFDNFEHVLDAKPLIARLMQHTPNCTFLVTSRNRLHLPGEMVLQINPLPVPETDALVRQLRHDLAHGQYTGDGLMLDGSVDNIAYAGVQLFLDRARRHNAQFAVHEEDFPDIATICAQTGGLPLALEMVAAWTEHLLLSEIAQELRQNRALLISESGGSVTSVSWHETVDALIEHSWHLLSIQEQGILIKLALFASTFDYKAATTIVGVSLPQLKRLTDSSLLQIAQPGRYTLHPLTRAFLREKWQAEYGSGSAETVDFWQQYCRYFLTFVVEQAGRLDGAETLDALARLRLEQDNIELAWRQAQQRRWMSLIEQSFDALIRFYWLNGAYQEIFIHCQSLQDLIQSLPHREQVDLLLFNIGVVRVEAHRQLSQPEEGLRVGRSIQSYVDDPSYTSQIFQNLRVRYHLAMAYLSMLASSLAEVKQHVERVAQHLSTASPPTLHGRYEMLLAYHTSFYNSNLELGLEYGERALDHYRESGNRWGEAEMLHEMGVLLTSYRRGNERIMPYLQESLRIRQQLRDLAGEAETLSILGETLHGTTAVQRVTYLQAALEIHRQLGHEYRQHYTHTALAAECNALGQYGQVNQCMGPLQTNDEVLADPNLHYLVLNSLSISASLQGDAERGKTLAQQMVALHTTIVPNQRLRGYMAMGYACVAGNMLTEAQTAFEQALAQVAARANPALEIVPRTGLAEVGYRMQMQKGQSAQRTARESILSKNQPIDNALTHVMWLYPHLGTEMRNHNGREFFWPHWVCYQVLRMAGDPRANDLLRQTHQQLLQLADELTDETLRSSFLENVAVNRAILEEVEALKRESVEAGKR
ncbi:MAG: BTAD domain-containing putative transcriptional regulator [Chloroflexota bacterium]